MPTDYNTIKKKIEDAYAAGVLTDEEYRNKMAQLEQAVSQKKRSNSVTNEIKPEEKQPLKTLETAVDPKVDNAGEKTPVEDDGIVYFDQVVDQKQSDNITYVKGVEEQRRTPRKKMPKVNKPKRNRKKIGCIVGCALLLIPVLFVAFLLSLDVSEEDSDSEDIPVEIVWGDLKLGATLPEPSVLTGIIHTNSNTDLTIDIFPITANEISSYIENCKGEGFTIDFIEEDDGDIEVFDEEGYKLEIESINMDDVQKMRISLNAPIKMSDFEWPEVGVATRVPAPDSNLGKITSDYEDSFSVYIGNTPKEKYDKYVKKCQKKGFDVDYIKYDNYYSADDKKGDDLTIEYYGNNIMYIHVYNYDYGE